MCFPASKRSIEFAKLGIMPRVKVSVQAVELTQNGCGRGSGLGFVKSGNKYFNTGAKNEGLLTMKRRLATARQ